MPRPLTHLQASIDSSSRATTILSFKNTKRKVSYRSQKQTLHGRKGLRNVQNFVSYIPLDFYSQNLLGSHQIREDMTIPFFPHVVYSVSQPHLANELPKRLSISFLSNFLSMVSLKLLSVSMPISFKDYIPNRKGQITIEK